MTDEYTPTLQKTADRDWWSADAGKHYRELAHWLRGVAAKCRLPYTQKELLKLAKRYDTRADRLSRRVSDTWINLAVISLAPEESCRGSLREEAWARRSIYKRGVNRNRRRDSSRKP